MALELIVVNQVFAAHITLDYLSCPETEVLKLGTISTRLFTRSLATLRG
jgi:hypothetical protein